LSGRKRRNREHLEHTGRNFFPQLLEIGIRSGAMELNDDVRDGIADACDIGETDR